MPGASTEFVGTVWNCEAWRTASRWTPGGGPTSGTPPLAMPPHGFHPRTSPATTLGAMLPVRPWRGGGRTVWDVGFTLGLTTRSMSATRPTRVGGQEATKEFAGRSPGGPEMKAGTCVSLCALVSGCRETHGPRTEMPPGRGGGISTRLMSTGATGPRSPSLLKKAPSVISEARVS